MFTPDDLRVRHFRSDDQGEVLRMVNIFCNFYSSLNSFEQKIVFQ